ncbi:MAG: YitT family protein [Blautia sp.]
MITKNELIKNEIINIAKIIIGCFIYAISVVWFIDPVHIIPGSVTGIGVVVKAVTGFPIGGLNFIINIPLVIIGTIVLGKRLLIYTGLSVFLTSVMIDGLAFLQPFTSDYMLASVFGGVVMGVGLGLIIDGGGTTGGTSLVGRLISRKMPHLPMGTILLVGDFIIITAGTIVLKDWDLFLYSVIDLYICVVAIDMVLYGPKVKNLSVVTSGKVESIVEAMKTSGKPCKVLFTESGKAGLLTKKKDISQIQHIVEKIDPEAGIISCEADFTYGKLLQ